MAKYYGYCYNKEGEFTKMIPLEFKTNEETGEETPILPLQCTLEICPDGIYYPKFVDGKWVKTVEPKPVEPQPEEPSELEKIKKQQDLMQQALDEMIIQNPTPDELAELKKRLALMQNAIDDLIISTTPATLEGGSK
ncbi:hypothetical protein [Bacillus sp. C30]|uniref:hypothetical protein n=1 Tax=Bacillus sp. C30 TaxID=1387733 RepID=UPI00349FAA31